MLGKYSNAQLDEAIETMPPQRHDTFYRDQQKSAESDYYRGSRERLFACRPRGRSRISLNFRAVRRYDDTIVAAINMGAHIDRISTGEMIDRLLPLLREAAATVKPLLL
jgi:IclR family pca regulon transcriptional regulator